MRQLRTTALPPLKRDCFISLGERTRFRIPSDVHAKFIRFCDLHRYTRQADAVVFLLDLGLRIAEMLGSLLFLFVRESAPGEEQ